MLETLLKLDGLVQELLNVSKHRQYRLHRLSKHMKYRINVSKRQLVQTLSSFKINYKWTNGVFLAIGESEYEKTSATQPAHC